MRLVQVFVVLFILHGHFGPVLSLRVPTRRESLIDPSRSAVSHASACADDVPLIGGGGSVVAPTCAQLRQVHAMFSKLLREVDPATGDALLLTLGLPEMRDPQARAVVATTYSALGPWLDQQAPTEGQEPPGTPSGATQPPRESHAALAAALLRVSDELNTLLAAQRPAAFAAVRRMVVAALWTVRRGAGDAWDQRCDAIHHGILLRLYMLHLASSRARGAVEFTHVSKAGGTSMCHLANENNCTSPHMDWEGNCMIPGFNDAPRWTTLREVPVKQANGNITYTPWRPHCSYDCREWLREPEVTCHHRQNHMRSGNWTFYANEATLHGSSIDARSAQACSEFVNVIVLRDALNHTLSLMQEIRGMFNRLLPQEDYNGPSSLFPRDDLEHWKVHAPAAVNNYFTRSLLGRHAFCAPLDSLHALHLSFAQAKLLSFDVVLLLGEDDLNDVAFAWGLGWRHTLRGVKLRIANEFNVPELWVMAELSRSPQQLQQLTALNTLDQQLVHFGRVVLQLDAALYAAVEQLARQPASDACGGGDTCFARLVAPPTDNVRGVGAGADAAAAAEVGSWNARSAAWVAAEQARDGSGQCGFVGRSQPR